MDQVQTRRRIAKPTGLFILSVFDFVVVGLIPLLTTLLYLRNTELELPFAAVLISVALPVFVMAASVWAMIGDNPARYVLLTLVTLTSINMIISGVMFLTGEILKSRMSSTIGMMVRAVFWLVINWWYLNRAHVVAYFRQSK